MSKIAEKQDPEFFKYLQENDPELLNFDPKADVQSENGDGDDPMEEDERIPVLTKEHLKTWQRALLEVCLMYKQTHRFILSLFF
jgi:nucleolar complex protein 2